MIAHTRGTGQAASLSCVGDSGRERWIYGLGLWMKVRRDGRVLKMGSLYTTRRLYDAAERSPCK